MAKRHADLINPDSNDSKTNQRRRRSMFLLQALGIEALLNSRLKNLIEFFFPSKEQTFSEDALQTAYLDSSFEQTPELSALESLLETLHSAAIQFISNVKNALQEKITQAERDGNLSNETATHLNKAVDNALTPRLLDSALKLHKKNPNEAQAEIARKTNRLEHQGSRQLIQDILERQKAPTNTNKQQAPEAHGSRRDLFDVMELLGTIKMMRRVQRDIQPYSLIKRQQTMHNIREFLNGPGQYHQIFQEQRVLFSENVRPAFSSINSGYMELSRFSIVVDKTRHDDLTEQLAAFITPNQVLYN